ncbi:MAG: DUF433 domain-containing protein [Deltaproteobacteria bacterium]|nr:DUF433 domain-containing protein [Deltaproteobacteria bacterium]
MSGTISLAIVVAGHRYPKIELDEADDSVSDHSVPQILVVCYFLTVTTAKATSGQSDRRYLPAYSVAEGAHYLGLPTATLRAWALGQRQGDKPPFKAILRLPDPKTPILSFVNLVEAHVLGALRRQHNVPLQTIRKALQCLRRHFPSSHPLADHLFATDGVSVFVEKLGQLVEVTDAGQVAMMMMLEAHLERVSRDAAGVPIKLYPFTRWRGDANEPKAVEIDPRVSFGRPVLVGTGIPTAVIAERYKAGETIAELVEDYHRTSEEIEEALRCELKRTSAAA